MRRPIDPLVIGGMFITGDFYNPFIAQMIEFLRRKILKVERIPPEDPKNKKCKYYHNYKYFILEQNLANLKPYERFIIDFI